MNVYLETYPDSGKSAHVAARAYSSGSQILREKDPATTIQYRERAVNLLQGDLKGFDDVRHFRTASMDAVRDHPEFVRCIGNSLRTTVLRVGNRSRIREAVALHGLSVKEHLTECQRLANDGYRIRSIDGLSVNGTMQAASVWHHPDPGH